MLHIKHFWFPFRLDNSRSEVKTAVLFWIEKCRWTDARGASHRLTFVTTQSRQVFKNREFIKCSFYHREALRIPMMVDFLKTTQNSAKWQGFCLLLTMNVRQWGQLVPTVTRMTWTRLQSAVTPYKLYLSTNLFFIIWATDVNSTLLWKYPKTTCY